MIQFSASFEILPAMVQNKIILHSCSQDIEQTCLINMLVQLVAFTKDSPPCLLLFHSVS